MGQNVRMTADGDLEGAWPARLKLSDIPAILNSWRD